MSAIELLTIGTELLLGFTLDTNSAELGQALAAAGLTVVRRTTVPDHPDHIRDAVAGALARTGLVLCTGGLGPTSDDVTKKVVADLFGMPLEFREEIWTALVERFARFGRVAPERNRGQAEVPRGAVVLSNRWGTAPGLWLEGEAQAGQGARRGIAILLPGVPSEMRNLLRHEVLPRLAGKAGDTVVRSRTLRTTALPESAVAERLDGVEDALAPLSLAYLPGTPGVDLRLTAWGLPAALAEQKLEAGGALLRSRLGGAIYGEGETDLAAVVLALAREGGLTLAVAESCTGGGLGARLTGIPGSSDVFVGGIIAYDNRVKQEQLGVPAEMLAEHGAVSEQVACAMALGAARRFGTRLAAAVTGIAGPAGGTAEKPVGLVYLAVADGEQVTASRTVFSGDRAEIRARAAQAALNRLRQELTRG
jgi:nicotinamide-nucleotide amidase